MPIKVTCSQCGGILHAPDDSAGKRGRCPTCGTVLTIAGEIVGASPSQFGAPPAPRPAAPQQPITNPWGSLPGGPDDGPVSVPARDLPPVPKPTYDLARDPLPPRVPDPVAPTRGSRVPPDPRKYSVSDPFAKPGKPNDEQAETNRAWLRVRGGLGWVRTALLLGLLSVLAFCTFPILQAFGVKLPDQTPGFLKIPNYSQAEEIRLLAVLVPFVLGLLCKMIGRLGVSGTPAVSGAKGTAVFSSLATLLAIGGFAAFAIISGLAMKDGNLVPQLTPVAARAANSATVYDKVENYVRGIFIDAGEVPGMIQGLGLVAFLISGLLAEVWFVASLGRMAASLHHRTATGRVNRFVVLVGFLIALVPILLVLARVYFKPWTDANVWAKWESIEEKWRVVAAYGVVAVVALGFAVLYWRVIGGVRTAIRENVDPAV